MILQNICRRVVDDAVVDISLSNMLPVMILSKMYHKNCKAAFCRYERECLEEHKFGS